MTMPAIPWMDEYHFLKGRYEPTAPSLLQRPEALLLRLRPDARQVDPIRADLLVGDDQRPRGVLAAGPVHVVGKGLKRREELADDVRLRLPVLGYGVLVGLTGDRAALRAERETRPTKTERMMVLSLTTCIPEGWQGRPTVYRAGEGP